MYDRDSNGINYPSQTATIPQKKSAGGSRNLSIERSADRRVSVRGAATLLKEHQSFHHGKHHRAYVENANKMIVATELADLPLDQIVIATVGKADRASIFNNAAQAWNHSFYWHCLKPKGGGEPPAALKHKMETAFGSVDACKALAIDVWEHAYYLDYQNKRADHVNAVIDKLTNWEFAAANLESFEQNRRNV
jgi:superoxide dismutase